MNCANEPCETCPWQDTCERYLENLELEEDMAWWEYETIEDLFYVDEE